MQETELDHRSLTFGEERELRQEVEALIRALLFRLSHHELWSDALREQLAARRGREQVPQDSEEPRAATSLVGEQLGRHLLERTRERLGHVVVARIGTGAPPGERAELGGVLLEQTTQL